MKIGILGVGLIGDLTAPTMMAIEEVECYAVASRTLSRAEEFAAKYGFQKAYGSYEELLNDPEVELVYIATPHSHHREYMLAAMEKGKAVFCEKAFTVNAAEAREVKETAERKGLFLAEAIWPRYMPSREMIDRVIASGVIGTPKILTANLSYVISQNKRIVDPTLAGGALLDVGVYGLNFALMHFGADIERVESSVQMTDTGVDAQESITLFYKDGRMAVLTHGIYSRSDRKGIIYGDKGYIVVENINNPQNISVYDTNDKLLAYYDVPAQISGYEYQFCEVDRCLKEGKRECPSMPLEESVRMMELMDHIRSLWGLKYPMEK